MLNLKTKYVFIGTIVFYVLLFIGCKKYPEDGKWSKTTVKDRLINKWGLKECLVDGVDSIDNQYNIIIFNPCSSKIDTTDYTLKNSILEFRYYKTKVYGTSKEGYRALFGVKNILKTTANNIDCAGAGNNTDYNLINKKSSVQFNTEILRFQYKPNSYKVLFNLNNAGWKIRKLTDKELIIETINSNNKEVRLKFNKV